MAPSAHASPPRTPNIPITSDQNDNRKLNGKERIHTEYFHTTPDDEAADVAGMPITLVEFHGCIHLKPKDIDTMIAKGYFKAGNKVVVHRYDETLPGWPEAHDANAPFEVHFSLVSARW